MNTKIYIILILSSMHCLLNAQEDTVKKPIKLYNLSLEELMNIHVFSASKKIEKASEAPAIISVVQRKDIENMGVTSLIDIFKYIPGIETSIGSDGQYRLSIRGTRKEGNILMLINGQPMNNFYDGKTIYDLPANFIEKIEIIRGPGSTLFGTGALAGVINIYTINTKSITANAGINNSFLGNVNYDIIGKKIKWNISGGYTQSDGANNFIESDAANKQNWSLTNGDHTYKTQRWNKDAYVATNLSVGNFTLNMFGISRKQGAWAGPLYIASPNSNLQTNEFIGALSYDFKVKDVIVITPKIYSNAINHDFINSETPDNYISTTSGNIFTEGKKTHEKYNAMTYGGELFIRIKVNEHCNILTGNIFERLSLSNYNLTRNYKIVGDEYKGTLGNYDNIQLLQRGKERKVFANIFQVDYKWEKINLTAGVRYDQYSDFGESVNPRLGITYNASKIIRFKGLYGKAFRAPTFQELYDNTTLGNQYGVKGNELLKPETIQTFELGTEIKSKKIIFRYNVFYNLNKNLIRIYDSRGSGSIGIYQNIGNLNTYGHEAEAIVALSSKLIFFINTSQFVSVFEWNTENIRKGDINFLNKQTSCDKQLKNIPTIRTNAGFHFTLNKVHIFTGLNFGGTSQNNKRFYLEASSSVNIPAYLQANFNIAYQVNDKCKLQLSANNLGKKYSDPDESTNIDTFGQKGLVQPTETFLLIATFKL